MATIKEVKEKLGSKFDTFSIRGGIFTVRKEFYYMHGIDSNEKKQQVLETFPNAEIVDFGTHYTAFKGGASTANQSHWFVKFKITENSKEVE